MTRSERFWTAFAGGQPDKVPVTELEIDRKVFADLARLFGIDASSGRPEAEFQADVLEALDLDAVCCAPSQDLRPVSETQARDKFGRTFNLSVHGEPLPGEPRVVTLADAEAFDMASALADADFAPVCTFLERFGPDRACCMWLTDPYKEAWRTVGGMENLLLAFAKAPPLVDCLVRAALDYVLRVVEVAAGLGIRAFIMSGDYAMETGLLFSVDMYRRYLRPAHREIVDAVHAHGGLIAKHSDGIVWGLLDDWLEVGFDGLHPVQPQCMDIAEVKEAVAGRMSVWGNIDCRTLLVLGTPGEVREGVRRTIEVAAPGGGYILTSSNSIHPNVPAENYLAMVEAAHKFGRYGQNGDR